ncbi:MAG: dicarboxylate/amino acid:cation symporter [Phycisphaerales bacterium]|jgi:proton glutamate symport protein|nr:dicarboxylate/amino acid:cation symporter [Phycisphaerales bacterium]
MNERGMALHWKVLIALGLGLAVGWGINEWWTAETWRALGVGDAEAFQAFKDADANAGAGFAAATARFAGGLNEFVGKFFLQSLRFIAVPIVLFSLVIAVAGVGDVRRIGRIGIKTLVCFLFTLAVAVTIAVVLGKLVAPGTYVTEEARAKILAQYAGEASQRVQSAHQLKDQGVWAYLLGIVPVNPFNAIANAQMMQVVAAAFLLGVGLTMIPRERSGPVVAFCEGVAEAVMALVRVIMKLAPLAVFCLIVQFVAGVGIGAISSVLAYALSVIAGLALVLFLEYPLLMLAVTPRGNRVGYKRFFRAMAPAQTLAFSSSSSSATLPVTIQSARDLGAPAEIVNFVCPMGTTLNMDGTALYQVISVLFLAQLYGMELTLAQHITVGVMAAVVAVGTPGLPGASVIMMAIVLESVGVPTEGIAIVLAVDRVLDMCRTIVNVSGDAVACVVVAGSEGTLEPSKSD